MAGARRHSVRHKHLRVRQPNTRRPQGQTSQVSQHYCRLEIELRLWIASIALQGMFYVILNYFFYLAIQYIRLNLKDLEKSRKSKCLTRT